MHFQRVNATFYDAVNLIHGVITTASLFPNTAKFILVGIRNNKTQQIICCKINRIRIHSAAVYKKYLTGLGEMIIFSPRRENYLFSQPS